MKPEQYKLVSIEKLKEWEATINTIALQAAFDIADDIAQYSYAPDVQGEPVAGVADLIKRLRIKAGMIELGELIAWGSDSALMREAADVLERAESVSAVQGEPVGRVVTVGGYPDESEHTVKWLCKYKDLKNGDLIYTKPQMVEQQPVVSALVEALESLIKGYVVLLEAGKDRITSLGGDCDPVSVMEQNDPWLRDARAILATHRKGGEA